DHRPQRNVLELPKDDDSKVVFNKLLTPAIRARIVLETGMDIKEDDMAWSLVALQKIVLTEDVLPKFLTNLEKQVALFAKQLDEMKKATLQSVAHDLMLLSERTR